MYDGKEEVLRNGANYRRVRTFEHVLRITLKTTHEMFQMPAKATTQYFGEPDVDWVCGGYPTAGRMAVEMGMVDSSEFYFVQICSV